MRTQRVLTTTPVVPHSQNTASMTLQQVERDLYRRLPNIIKNIPIDNSKAVSLLEGLQSELMRDPNNPYQDDEVDYVENILELLKPQLRSMIPESASTDIDEVFNRGSLQACIRMELDAQYIENILNPIP
jgi:hypothetical protein